MSDPRKPHSLKLTAWSQTHTPMNVTAIPHCEPSIAEYKIKRRLGLSIISKLFMPRKLSHTWGARNVLEHADATNARTCPTLPRQLAASCAA